MKAKRILVAAILLSALIPGLVVPGQTKKRVSTGNRRTTKPVNTDGNATASTPVSAATTSAAPTGGPAQTTTATAGTAGSAAITTSSGLIYIITRHGEGRQAQPGDIVAVHYTGLLGSGVKFDSSLDRGEPYSFKLGVGKVIKGWDEGIGKLRVGDQATLIIPPDLGYGARGAGGVIPPGATLIFVVELMDARPASNLN
jgi:peptidylprolyl isomerase